VPRAPRAHWQSDRRRDRQPEREECGKGWRSIDPHGYDAGKTIKGKKRHILVDTQGLMLQVIAHAAAIQDRDGGAILMASLFGLYSFLRKLYADGGYQGAEFRAVIARIMASIDVEIIKLCIGMEHGPR
jgi:hypothetical protein